MITQTGGMSEVQWIPGKQVAFKTFHNGSLKVLNVPYLPSSDNGKEGFIPHEVLFQLSHIFKYMNIHGLEEFDYQQFKMVKTPMVVSSEKKKAKKQFDDEKVKLAQYALKEWVNKYFEMSMKAKATVTNFDDLDNPNSEFNQAKRWLELFHERLEALPELHREIIEKKYLESASYPPDLYVYTDLHMTRTLYYLTKKEALYWLGLALWNHQEKVGS